MVAVIGALRLEHRNMASLLDIVEQEIDKASSHERPDYDLIKGVIDYCLTYPDQYHHPKEDLIYRALRVHDPEAAPAIDDLEAEHEELATMTRELGAALDEILDNGRSPEGWLPEMAGSFVEAYRRHMQKEESDFFSEALKHLAPEEWADIEAQITNPTDPLFDQRGAERLASLQRRVTSAAVTG